MSYIDTVLTLPLARNRGGRPITEATRELRALHAQHRRGEAEQDADTGDADKAVAGVQLALGQQGGARLSRKAEGWAWDFALALESAPEDRRIRLRDGGKPKRLIPPLRVIQAPVEVDTTTSLEYLRQMCSKYEHLGLDELVGPELVATADASAQPDLYQGRTFRVLHMAHAKVASSLLLYRGGELGNHLHVAVFAPKSNTIIRSMPLVRFIASSRPLERFPTEILQVETSSAPFSKRYTPLSTSLAVRVHSTTHFFSLAPEREYAGSPDTLPISIEHVASMPSSATEGRRHMDIALHPTEHGRVAVVDDQGGVWLWRVSSSGDEGIQLVREAATSSRGSFYLISWGTRPETLVVLSGGEMVSIDLEDAAFRSVTLLQLPRHAIFVEIDKTACERDAQLTCVLSSEEIIWLDEGKPGQSTLRWKHETGSMRGLSVMTFPQPQHECFILYSSSSPTLTVFHLTSETPIRLLCQPYTIHIPVKHDIPISYAFIDLQRLSDRPSDVRLLATTADGSILGLPISVGEDEEEREEALDHKWRSQMRRIWDDGLTELAEKGPVEGMPEDGLDKRPAARTLYDAQWVWQAISEDSDDAGALSAQGLTKYLRQLDAPQEHLMTGAELARDALMGTAEDDMPLRTHNLRPLRIALEEDELETSKILSAIDQVDIARDLVPVSQQTISARHIDGHSEGTAASIRQVHELLVDTYLPDADTLGPALKDARDRDARHIATLATDLALSMRVFSSDDLPSLTPAEELARPATSPEDVLQRAARLTLDEKSAPDVKLHYLKPAEDAIEHGGEGLPRPTIQTSTVQYLLSEWKVGSDPGEYSWKSWVSPADADADGEQQTALRSGTQVSARPIRPLPSPRGSPRPSQSQYAAPVFAPTATRSTQIPTLYSQPQGQTQIYTPTQPVPYSLPNMPQRKGVPVIRSHTQTQRLASPRPSPPPSPAPPYTASLGGGPGRAANVSPTIRRQAARSPETSTGMLGSGTGMGTGMGPAQMHSGAATQVERGPFGGRQSAMGEGDKKKKPKKRLGGF